MTPAVVGSILMGADDLVNALVASRIPHMHGKLFGPCVALGVIRRGTLVGGVVYHNYRIWDIELSCAFDQVGWALPGTVRALMAYPFNELDCRRVTAIIGRKNRKARKLLEDLGFKLEGVHERGLDGFEDAFSFGMLKEKCKWIKERPNGQADIRAAACS